MLKYIHEVNRLFLNSKWHTRLSFVHICYPHMMYELPNGRRRKFMKNRPNGYVTIDDVMMVIEKSIDSVNNWADLTNDSFGDREEKLAHLNELKNIIFILKWRYDDRVVFMFTGKTKGLESCVPIQDIVERDDDGITDYWKNRIRVMEHPTLSRVYINF